MALNDRHRFSASDTTQSPEPTWIGSQASRSGGTVTGGVGSTVLVGRTSGSFVHAPASSSRIGRNETSEDLREYLGAGGRRYTRSASPAR